MALLSRNTLLVIAIALILFTTHAHAFGAGNIASISAVEGKNWRHGDIEDLLKTVACIRHHKWNSMMIKRVYFGNWLRDYSQAMDVGALKKANGETIRVLVWLLSFLGFGYATAEFEVTSERLGVYRPEEHIEYVSDQAEWSQRLTYASNPKNYNDDEDARTYEPRLRGPIRPVELEIDPETGMKNYIANGKGDWATSTAFIKYSFERSIHHGRQYTQGSGLLSKGNDDELAEALRLLGQGLHTLEDFGAHTNYVELALIEMGHRNIFPLVGTQTGISLRGKHVFPLVTGTFGMVDFYHSVLGEATDHFTQSEISEMDNALGIAQNSAQSSNPLTTLVKLLSKVPGTKDLCTEAERLQAASMAQANANRGFNGGSSRGVEEYGGSSRGLDDYSGGSTRAGPGDYNSGYGHQSTYQQGYDYNQQQPPAWGQQSHDYSQQQQQSWQQPPHQSYQQPPPQQWGQPQDQQNYPGQASGYQSYNQASQPQWNQPHDPQSYTGHSQPHDQYNQAQTQPQHVTAGPTASGAPAQTSAAQPAGLPGAPNFDPAKTVKQIYPILAFRDKVVRTISGIIEKIPGLEALVDKIVETLTVFVLSLLAPFVRPVLDAVSKSLQKGSEGVIDSSGRHQYEVWTDPRSSDPTHSMLSKDHFSNILNEPAGLVAGEILKFIAPRVLYAWEHPEVPVEKVMQDIESIFHHPAIRNERLEIHRNMFNIVKTWKDSRSDRGRDLDNILSMESVRAGKNHKGGVNEHLGHGSAMGQQHGASQHSSQGGLGGMYQQAQGLMGGSGHGGSHQGQQGGLGGMYHQVENMMGSQNHGSSNQNQQGGMGSMFGQASNLYNQFSGHNTGHSSSGGYGGSGGSGGGLNDMLSMANKLPIPGVQNLTSSFGKFSSFIPGGRSRGIDDDDDNNNSSSSNTRAVGNESYQGQQSYESNPRSSDISVDSAYSIFGGSNVGGARELRDAMNRGNNRDRSPSPVGLQAPSGYEQYGSAAGGQTYGSESGQYGAQQGGYGGAPRDHDYYQTGSGGRGGGSGGGGASSSYYGS